MQLCIFLVLACFSEVNHFAIQNKGHCGKAHFVMCNKLDYESRIGFQKAQPNKLLNQLTEIVDYPYSHS